MQVATTKVGPHAQRAISALPSSSADLKPVRIPEADPLLVNTAARLGVLVLALLSVSGCVHPPTRPLLVRRGLIPQGGPSQPLLHQFKVVTYNVWGLPGWINGASSQRYSRIARELERMDSDLVLLQEVSTRRALDSIPAGGRWSVARTRTPGWLLGRNGLVVMSRHPILGGNFRAFDTANFPDSLMNKGALKVTIALEDGTRLNVWNVHLQAGDAPETRTRQIEQLAGWIRESDDGQVGDLVGGDFNATPTSTNYQALVKHLGPSFFETAGVEPFITFGCFTSDPEEARTLDYLFLKPRRPIQDLCVQPQAAFCPRTREDRLSDHQAIEALIEFSLAGEGEDSITNPLQRIQRQTPLAFLNTAAAQASQSAGPDK